MQGSDVSGKVAIVTGAGAGIGRACAEAFVAAGLRVAAMDIRPEGVSELEARLGADALFPVQVDIADPASCRRALEAVLARFGTVDILVNNAALGMNAAHPRYETVALQIEDVDEEVFRRFMVTNVCGAFNMSRQVVPSMRTRGWGRIVNIGTSYFTMMRPGFFPYGPSKAALEAWSLMLARELEGSGITVNVVLPGGPADTAMVPDREGLDRSTLIRPAMMAPPILGLCTIAADGLTGLRFLAVEWDGALADPAAQKRRPAAWPELAVPLAALPSTPS